MSELYTCPFFKSSGCTLNTCPMQNRVPKCHSIHPAISPTSTRLFCSTTHRNPWHPDYTYLKTPYPHVSCFSFTKATRFYATATLHLQPIRRLQWPVHPSLSPIYMHTSSTVRRFQIQRLRIQVHTFNNYPMQNRVTRCHCVHPQRYHRRSTFLPDPRRKQYPAASHYPSHSQIHPTAADPYPKTKHPFLDIQQYWIHRCVVCISTFLS
ncbi:hypothetical protein EDD18DRAFT_862083 [Armillaria luteobubalina]|uniref:Uncharacterized protein n=1 Tax=Armillaria luteobubalina TaxID=153913 RepID=A0AA39QCH4_9AGAR|nr:hypothetical protein EDD18DRAFT_862083 [Armillaria luteobubalina]